MTLRCRWCGRFGASPVTREIRQHDRDVYLSTDEWRPYTQSLCSECAACWSRDLPWNRAAVVEGERVTDSLVTTAARALDRTFWGQPGKTIAEQQAEVVVGVVLAALRDGDDLIWMDDRVALVKISDDLLRDLKAGWSEPVEMMVQGGSLVFRRHVAAVGAVPRDSHGIIETLRLRFPEPEMHRAFDAVEAALLGGVVDDPAVVENDQSVEVEVGDGGE